MDIAIQDRSEITILSAIKDTVNDVLHFQYHSRFDAEHYVHCHDCFEANLDFINEPEFFEYEEDLPGECDD